MAKIIKFPKDKKNKSSQVKTSNQKVTYQLESKRVLVSASIVSLMLLSVLFNFSTQLISEKNNVNRGVASFGEVVRNQSSTQWERDLLKRLNDNPVREIASIGSMPSLEEEFKMGTLMGKYSFKYKNGLVESAELSQGVEDGPVYILNRLAMLQTNYRLFSRQRPEFIPNSKKLSQDLSGQQEVYDVLVGGVKVSEVTIVMDKYSRMVSFKNAQLR